MQITSSAFLDGESIPALHTCEGENISPSLKFIDVPVGTQSLSLLMSDPDAPGKTFYHWILYNMPPEISVIEAGETPITTMVGKNDFGNKKYDGPCPPSGTHRYIFKLFSLSAGLDLESGESSMIVENAMQGLITGTAELMGTYSKENL